MSRIARRVHQPGVYFVTTDTWQRRQLFLKPEPARIVLERILECRDRGFYKLHEFVIMPEHLQMLLTPGTETSLEKAEQFDLGSSSGKFRLDASQFDEGASGAKAPSTSEPLISSVNGRPTKSVPRS